MPVAKEQCHQWPKNRATRSDDRGKGWAQHKTHLARLALGGGAFSMRILACALASLSGRVLQLLQLNLALLEVPA